MTKPICLCYSIAAFVPKLTPPANPPTSGLKKKARVLLRYSFKNILVTRGHDSICALLSSCCEPVGFNTLNVFKQ